MRWKFPKFKSGQLRRWEYLLPTGSSKETEQIAKKIISDSYLPKAQTPLLKILSGKILLENANFRQALELLVRIPWTRDFRLNLGMYPFKRSFSFLEFESSLRKSKILPEKWNLQFRPQVKGRAEWTLEDLRRLWEADANSENHRTTELSALLVGDEIILSVSLSGEPLNQRGNFQFLSKSAPIREDLARYLIERMHKILPDPDAVFVPFAGTGTLIRESVDSILGICFPHYSREYLFQDMEEFPRTTWDFLKKKTLKNFVGSPIGIWWNELNGETFEYTKNRMKVYQDFLKQYGFYDSFRFVQNEGDFFLFSPQEVWNTLGKRQRVWMLLNPPYGLRLGIGSSSAFYRKLGERLTHWWELPSEIGGFVLCPNEECWSVLIRSMGIKTDTIHVTHGGLDMRVVYF
ncbi:hypothetical protein [Leptospira borgpetersenii]|uniref:Uncharacterized protein n=1 Tax=Leptospira borgpetersenii str. Brem 328 TaxID=1049780 RepID=A0ABC9SCJ0_LEPBO|nr:hypothetical protein [Leptospira borgpetersenii]EMO10922.1 hypothetical protein LEP1GSC137_3975 [Leptospira borgpetersenii str. Noumea 25]ANH01459.1 Uncharacterized protein LB4E_2182 [Leptospira borgpetersenii str. 4E]EKQ99057.1 hypothetical protein LEP1GSC121_2657 [Leptospira borgpetersenii serovar Castellonis str. 200801910]EMN12888.1 hypothetical protein LEP1GSC055_3342 [Leptospira borgpetersenii str. Brem 307]EMN15498.1 hypothetical protein LEP1GSC056_3578 [Leptospira borgpetersenii str